MSESAVFKRNEDIVEAEIDGDLVMMSIETGKYFGLDPIAKHIWQLIEQPISQAAICIELQQHYDVSESQCIEEVERFLSRMVELGVVEAA